jgi:hypothetical protein
MNNWHTVAVVFFVLLFVAAWFIAAAIMLVDFVVERMKNK